MKNPLKSPYFGAICLVFVFPVFLLLFNSFKTKELSHDQNSYKFFHVLTTEDPWERSGRSRALILKTEILDDVSKYKQTFFLQNIFPDVRSNSTIAIKKHVHKNDTLILGILLSDFLKIQDYGSNFVKNDFYSRELKIYWIKKKDQVIIDPGVFSFGKTNGDNLLPILFFLASLGGIGRIVYLISQKVKFFT